MKRGFTLIEILVVIAIIGILASVVLTSIGGAKKRAIFTRTKLEMREIENAMYMYLVDSNNEFPPDVSRALPPGLEAYLSSGEWPDAPYKDAVYDWDNWAPGDLSHNPKEQVYQISVRFCDVNGNNCTYPDEPWAAGFDRYSAVYWCFEGPCRAHSSRPVDHPGYCLNCN